VQHHSSTHSRPDVHTHVISDFGADDESDAKPDVRTHVISDFGILVHIAW